MALWPAERRREVVRVSSRHRGAARSWGRRILTGILLVAGAVVASAQVPMPDLRQMAGMPLPSADLPDGTVSVRLVREALSNNLVDHPVELHLGDRVVTARTDETGRAQFSGLRAGATAHAVAVVERERLESRSFTVPARGGVRILLVAGLGAREAPRPPGEPPAPGAVALGGDSRFVIELDEEAVRVYGLLDLVNPARAPVTTSGPIVFEMPRGAQGTSLLEGSSPQATANGPRVTVTGPFQPGTTPVRFAYLLPYAGSRLEIAQPLPVALDNVAVIVERWEGLRVTSPQIARIQEFSASGRRLLFGDGPGLPAGGSLHLTLDGLPHPPAWPRLLALALAGVVILWGLFTAAGGTAAPGAASRRALETRREKLFDELVRLELASRTRSLDEARYRRRREELLARLEHIYAELDGASAGLATRSGLRHAPEAAVAPRSSAAG